MLVVLLLATASRVDAGPAPSKLAVIDTDRLWAAGGVAVWLAARAQLDAERTSYAPAENPGATPPPRIPTPDLGLPDGMKRDLERKLAELERNAARNSVWTAHEHEVLDPIVAEAYRGLERYARAHGLGLVLDRAKLGDAMLVVAPDMDITDRFIRDYNRTTAPGRPVPILPSPFAPSPRPGQVP